MDCRNDLKYEKSDLKTVNQWKKLKKVPKDNAEGVEMYPNGFRQEVYTYYHEDEVRPMNEAELEEIRAVNREKARKRRAIIKARKDEERKEVEQQMKYEENKLMIMEYNQLEPEHYENLGKIVIDTETTGLSSFSEILQLSIIDFNGNEVFNEYFKPMYHDSWEEAEAVHGISPEDLKDKKPLYTYIPKIKGILSAADTIIGYNTTFDIDMLDKYIDVDFKHIKTVDVMLDFAEIYGEWNEYFESYTWQKLVTCANYYGYEFKAHDSLEDVRATLFCYKKMNEKDEI